MLPAETEVTFGTGESNVRVNDMGSPEVIFTAIRLSGADARYSVAMALPPRVYSTRALAELRSSDRE